MNTMHGVAIRGTGSYVPEKVLTNHDLEKIVETSDDWIRTRTGISERRIAADDEATSDIAFGASERALEDAGYKAEDVDLIVVATLSPDCPFPNTGCFLQRRLNAFNAACFSVEAACSGFVYAMEVAANFLRTGVYRNVLVVGAEKMSSLLNWEDRTTCVLFGDGAGAVLLEQTHQDKNCCLGTELGADGNHTDLLYVPAGGSVIPTSEETVQNKLNSLKMNGREIFKLAVNAMVRASQGAMNKAGVDASQLRWLIPHQANTRIIQGVGNRLEVPDENVFMNLDKYGNTSAASIPLALDEAAKSDQVSPGDYILMVAFGGGLTWGASVIQWPDN